MRGTVVTADAGAHIGATIGVVPDDDLRRRREATVREHMDSENRHDFDATIATFASPRYELMATGQVFDGESEVRRYFATSRSVFPDQRNELVSLRHTDDGVLVELDLLGTHANGRSFRSRMAALFLFEEGGHGIVCERVYFDQGSILRQLGLD
jgi:ketosteroid isomerase-like protein